MSTIMTFDDLRTMLVDCAGLAEGVDFTERHLDTELDSLGYDSLAVLETAARIKQEFGVDIPDNEVIDLRTPRLILDRVNTSISAAVPEPRGDEKTPNNQLYSEHRIVVDAEPSVVFDLIADVSLWPVIFRPTVHTRVLERSAEGDRFEIWATAANGDVNCWTSRRKFDPAAGFITFAQDRDTPLFGFMGGSWKFEPLGDGRTEIVLGHYFNPSPDQPDAVQVIGRELDHNGTAELEALRAVAALPGGIESLLLTFTDTVELAGPAAEAYEFVWAADQWPERLPHVAAVKLVERAGGAQDMTMETRAPDGSVHTTRSIRVGLRDGSIAYKQTTLPKPLLGHSGVWEFFDGAAGATMRSSHTALIDPAAAVELFGPEISLEEVVRRVRAALAGNSKITMEHASRYSASAGISR